MEPDFGVLGALGNLRTGTVGLTERAVVVSPIEFLCATIQKQQTSRFPSGNIRPYGPELPTTLSFQQLRPNCTGRRRMSTEIHGHNKQSGSQLRPHTRHRRSTTPATRGKPLVADGDAALLEVALVVVFCSPEHLCCCDISHNGI